MSAKAQGTVHRAELNQQRAIHLDHLHEVGALMRRLYQRREQPDQMQLRIQRGLDLVHTDPVIVRQIVAANASLQCTRRSHATFALSL